MSQYGAIHVLTNVLSANLCKNRLIKMNLAEYSEPSHYCRTKLKVNVLYQVNYSFLLYFVAL